MVYVPPRSNPVQVSPNGDLHYPNFNVTIPADQINEPWAKQVVQQMTQANVSGGTGASPEDQARLAMYARANLPPIGQIPNFTPDEDWVRRAEAARQFAYSIGQGAAFDADLKSGRDPYGQIQWWGQYAASPEGVAAAVQAAQPAPQSPVAPAALTPPANVAAVSVRLPDGTTISEADLKTRDADLWQFWKNTGRTDRMPGQPKPGAQVNGGGTVGAPPGSVQAEGPYQTPWGAADENTPPGGMGLDWWAQWALIMDKLTDDSGVIRDPVTGKPLTNADGSLQRTLAALNQEAQIRQADEGLRQSQVRIDDARRSGDLDRAQREAEYARTLQLDRDRLAQDQVQFDATLGYNIGQALGRLDGQNTLERDKFEEDRTSAAYQRASNPINAFEEELRRSTGGTYWNTQTGQAQVGQTPATVAPAASTPIAAVAQGIMRPAVEPDVNAPSRMAAPGGNAAGIRTPAFLQVLRSGGVTPTVGGINAPNVSLPANQAALGRSELLTMNRKAEPRLSSVQKMIRSSYSKAGGIGAEEEADLLSKGTPTERSLAPSFSGR